MDRTPHLDWPVPGRFPALAAAGVHVWCAWLDDPRLGAAGAVAALSDAERAKAAAFHFETDRRRYVVAHAMVRQLLARYLDAEVAALAFVTGPSGKPALAGETGLQFNLSHSGPLALFGVARGFAVGVDVEQRWEMPDLAVLEERMFTPAARRRQQRLAPEPRLRGFYRRWTQLEAIGKCRGTGLELENLAPGTEHLTPADPAAGFTGCLACERPPDRVDFLGYAPEVASAPPSDTAPHPQTLPGLPHPRPTLVRLSST
jgi:4'-phosphopantetheinyl transferase